MNSPDFFSTRRRDFHEALVRGSTPYQAHMAAPRLRLSRVLEAAEQLPHQTVCDFGCGSATVLFDFRKRFPGARLAGVDANPDLIRRNVSLYRDINWVQSDVCDPNLPKALPFAPEFAVAMEIIEHVPDPLAFLKVVQKAMAPGGVVFLSTQSGQVFPTERHLGHYRHFSPKDLETLCHQAGLSVRSIWNEGFPFHDFSKWAANLVVDKTIRDFGVDDYGPYQKIICLGLRALFCLNSKKRGKQLFAIAVNNGKRKGPQKSCG